jgi:hypothetical protein
MSLTPNARRRAAFLFGRRVGLRLTSDAFAQLEEKLHAEREQHAFVVAQLEREKAMLLRALARARYELAKRDVVDAFANAPSPSTLVH